MNQYQRMVSYLYEYKQGVKGVNVGYVRIEQRGSFCRISVQMRGRNLGQVPAMALFHQEEDGIVTLPFGQLTEHGGEFRCRVETDADNLSGSGVSLQEVEGLILYLGREYYVATTWKNQAVYLGEMRNWQGEKMAVNASVHEAGQEGSGQNGEKVEESEAQGEMTAEQKTQGKMTVEWKAQGEMAAEQKAQGENTAERKAQGEMPAERKAQGEMTAERKSQEKMAAGRKSQGEMAAEQKAQGEMVPERKSQEEMAVGQKGLEEKKQNREQEQDIQKGRGKWQQAQNAQNRQEMQQKSGSAEKGGQEEAELQQMSQEIEASFSNDRESMEKQAICGNCPFQRKSLDYGKRILMSFPTMRPFPDNQRCACVRIEPQDLGCLPMHLWALANNNFLLQGYYCYRHLIFVEVKEKQYALGVPGIYSERDREQARRFGFTDFRPICSGRHCTGAFGYWMIDLK